MKYDISFDFDKNEIDTTRSGNIILITGKTALINRIRKVLHTAANRYAAYFDSGYGNQFEDYLVGKTLPSAFIVSEIERIVKDCVGKVEGVTDINSFSVTRDGAAVTIEFKAETIYGTESIKEVV